MTRVYAPERRADGITFVQAAGFPFTVASNTINLRLAAVRRIAYEAADAGLLSPELAARIRRVRGCSGAATYSTTALAATIAAAIASL
jgi:hypothetical protein